MDIIKIEGTKSTPSIHFDPHQNVLSVIGQSYPENAFKFYEPILSWLNDYLEQLAAETKVNVELKLPYINTSSTKCLMVFLEKLDEAYQQGKQILVNWYYNIENESELECAEEFKEDLSLPFHIEPKED
jgi:hypothetical protein